MVKAIWNGAVIAESNQTEIVEGNHYFPPESLSRQYFRESNTTSVCAWKGLASYYTLVVDGKENRNAAWYYSNPKPAAAKIAGKVAFWKGVKVTDDVERPGFVAVARAWLQSVTRNRAAAPSPPPARVARNL